jgi:uncharacterized protein (TIGR02266 family)
MSEDPKRGAAPRPPFPPRPGPPRPAPSPPSGERRVALAEIAALVEEEVDLVDDVSVSAPPKASASGAPLATPASAPPIEEIAPVFGGAAPVAPPPAFVLEEAAPVFAPPATSAKSAPPKPVDDADSRNHRRFPYEINVDIVSEHNFYAGLSLNISEGGLFVATHVEYPVGTRLEIRLLLPGDEEPTSLMTEVRWVRQHHDNADAGAGMGLRFIDLTPTLLAKVSRFAQNRDPLYYEDD